MRRLAGVARVLVVGVPACRGKGGRGTLNPEDSDAVSDAFPAVKGATATFEASEALGEITTEDDTTNAAFLSEVSNRVAKVDEDLGAELDCIREALSDDGEGGSARVRGVVTRVSESGGTPYVDISSDLARPVIKVRSPGQVTAEEST